MLLRTSASFRPLRIAVLAGLSLVAIAAAAAETDDIETILVTADRPSLLGSADTASDGSVSAEELDLRPAYRVGQLLESVPGLVVTTHSGEGKAAQYLLRGFNLDHGTDFANFVDDMPVNRPTNAHGQGYSDLNFILPQLLDGIDYSKGPYYAATGDFGAVGAGRMRLADEIPDQISTSVGTLGDEDIFAGGTRHFADGGRLLAAADVSHLDGPYDPPENYRRITLASRYSQGSAADGYSVTALYYKGQGRNDTDQPLRAIEGGLIGRYGLLDTSDGNSAERWSLSGHFASRTQDWTLVANAYVIHSDMMLWNDFTHFLFDPVNGDQEQQDETRLTLGGGVSANRALTWGNIEADTVIGLQERFDDLYVDRRHTHDRMVLGYCNDGNGEYSVGDYACTADRIRLSDTAPYIAQTVHWLSWLRSDVGVREEYYAAHDSSLLTSFAKGASEWLTQPKGSLAVGPWMDTEFYVSAGKGFHSDDARGVLGAAPQGGTQLAVGHAPLLARAYGEEAGLRSAPLPGLQIALALFREDFASELMYQQDLGQDQATAPSRREGYDLAATYRPTDWLAATADWAAASARYFKNRAALAGEYGIVGGTHIANAPAYVASAGLQIDNLGPWFGGIQERILGPYPLTDGPANPHSPGYRETNAEVGYRLRDDLKARLSVFNLLNSKAYSMEYYYTTAIGGAPQADYQVHPLEPLSARLSLTLTL